MVPGIPHTTVPPPRADFFFFKDWVAPQQGRVALCLFFTGIMIMGFSFWFRRRCESLGGSLVWKPCRLFAGRRNCTDVCMYIVAKKPPFLSCATVHGKDSKQSARRGVLNE